MISCIGSNIKFWTNRENLEFVEYISTIEYLDRVEAKLRSVLLFAPFLLCLVWNKISF